MTKPEQAKRANGVHTEVSVGRQGLPPVGGCVFHGNYPSAELFGHLGIGRLFVDGSI